jgi:serine/threonine protein kinase
LAADTTEAKGQAPPTFALKIINKDKIGSLVTLKRVDTEIKAQTTLRHRGILHIEEVYNSKKGLYLVMEKVSFQAQIGE